MASITILGGHKNLLFAAKVAEETGAQFAEGDQLIVISDSPNLVIPRYCYDQAFDPDGSRCQRGDPTLDSGWRSLLLNKRGYLRHFGDFEIVISDEKPGDEKPAYLLRFPDAGEKATTEKWAERMGFDSLREYILDAITAYNATWREHAEYEDRRAEGSA